MGGSTPNAIAIEVVMIGYHDPRLDRPTPYGFVFKAGSKVTVHHRADVVNNQLPKLFEFTAKNMPAVILKACNDFQSDRDGLYEFLLSTCYDGVGSFRCWQPYKCTIKPEELDGYWSAFREFVDNEMGDYKAHLKEYIEECNPAWRRLPSLDHSLEIQSLSPV